MKILIISAFFPSPKADSAGVLDVYHFIKDLSQINEIYLISLVTKQEKEEKETLINLCKEVILVEAPVDIKSFGNIFFTIVSLFSKYPAIAYASKSKMFENTIKSFLNTHSIDVIHIEFTQLAHIINMINNHYPIVIDESDIAFIRRSRYTKNLSFGLKKIILFYDCYKLKKYELYYLKKYDGVIVRTKTDKEILLQTMPKQKLIVIPPWVELPSEFNFSKRGKSLIFYAAMWRNVNVEAAKYFIQDVLPLILPFEPEIKFIIVGSRPPASLMKFESNHVRITGFVANVFNYYEQCAISVAPLLSGSGIKGKVIQALGLGIPVVTTSIGAEGIPCNDENGLFIEDEPQKMAKRILWLLKDDKYKQYISCSKKFVNDFYNWDEGIKLLNSFHLNIIENKKRQ